MGEKVLKQKFWIRNTGNCPLVIKSVRNPRGDCMVDWPREPIMPKDSALAIFHCMRIRRGLSVEPVSIDSNDPENPIWVVRFRILPAAVATDESMD